MTHLVALCCISLYVIVSVLLLIHLWRARTTSRLVAASRVLFTVAWVLHSVTMVLVFRDPALIALDNGADYFLWVSWVLSLVYLVGHRWVAFPLLGAFIVPAIVLFMGSSSYLLHMKTASLIPQTPSAAGEGLSLSLFHGIPALIAVVSLALALAVSVAFLVVERRLKKRSTLVLEGPGVNLQLLDSLNRHLVQIGFVAISLVIVSGGLWAVIEQKAIFTPDTSVISGLLVWTLLAGILHARLVLRWSPRRVSRLTVFVTASFLVSVFVVLAFAGRITHATFWS
jgi:ABC-type transport system involved in cytochrome c biogenesis permease subunit